MTQRYRGSDFQVPVGSFPAVGHLDPDHTGTILGFRLVHDDADRVSRGGGWNGDPQFARAAFRGNNGPELKGGNLGFRLTRENT